MKHGVVGAVLVLATATLSACGGHSTTRLAARRVAVSTTEAVAATSSTPVPSTTTVVAVRRSGTTSPPTRAVAVPATTGAPALLVQSLHGLGAAQQVITVTSSSWSASTATLQAFEKDGGAWRTIVGPTTAYGGVGGFAPPADKREGDGRTPAGMYGFQYMFGTAADPGVQYTYRVAGPSDVWVDDPASSLYNTWQQEPANGRWASAEQLDQPGPYQHAAVIAWNTARVPGRGSAIFLHVSLGHGTAGCVAVNGTVLVQVLRWLDPARQPVIAMGPDSYVRQL
jgi:L,D-peptidoglycan transpeptidase YkuD (ErfK/YbiS/YcfS/YnhG family)